MNFRAHAKTNLSLRVLGKRDDGFHAIETRMVRLSVSDKLELEWTDENQIDFTCSDPELPTGEENLVIKAVRALERHANKTFSVRIHLEKNIPSGAGLGGGSSDAATVLKALNEMGNLGFSIDDLCKIAAEIGSDVPFFVHDSACDCSGRGEIVVPVPEFSPQLPILLAKPAFGISAGWAYQNFSDSHQLPGISYTPQLCPWGLMTNDLERPVFEKFLVLARMKMWLLDQPEVHAAIMSGSGSTMIAVLNNKDTGEVLAAKIRERFGNSTWTWVGSSL